MINDKLNTELKFLKGVGPKKAELFASELGLFTYGDLIHYYPYKYIDKSKFYKISEVNQNLAYIQIKGKFTSLSETGTKFKKRLSANFTDETGTIELVWFKGVKWIKDSIKPDIEYIIFGKPTIFNNKFNIIHPEIEELSKYDSKINSALEPAYNTTEKMKNGFLNSKTILRIQQTLMQQVYSSIWETLPAYITDKYKLLPLKEALKNIHFPTDLETLKKAEYRLKFEELFYIQLKLLRLKKVRIEKSNGYQFSVVGDFFNNFYKNNLPFELTNAQKRVIKEIRVDFGSGKQMNRLLQGDVGSGKTLVALMTALIAIDNNYQTAIMAPTEILATQHFESIKELLNGLGLNITLLTGSTKAKERRILHQQLEDGEIHILIGTHALIEDKVKFKNLGYVVIDEQHRFGVAQRAKMWKKNTKPPHILVMTATPIPRTLAMTLYGDLDVSIIDELPPGRKEIKTVHRFDSQRLRVFKFIKDELDKGRQVYIVYPLIQENEKMDFKDLEDGLESITRAFPQEKYGISVVHGKMKPTEKEKAMNFFVKGVTKIMVATTVIEVGVNVPNASVMIIESAERFGLSQLHQLRGRVGRGAEQSYCILMTGNKLTNDGRKRIETMVRSSDGFEISEVDLKLRGSGSLDGTQQSGMPIELNIANLAKDGQILEFVRQITVDILEKDPSLNESYNQILKKNILNTEKQKFSWDKIS